jgi:hypothetical protein
MLPTSARTVPEWALWAIVLNFFWEVAQLRFYAFAPTVGRWERVWDVVHCTAGDGLIALVSYAAAALVTRAPDWPARRPKLGLTVVLCVGLAWTAWSEWQNVYVNGAWAYAASMPTILGIGLLPMLQWLALPPLVLLAVRYRLRA